MRFATRKQNESFQSYFGSRTSPLSEPFARSRALAIDGLTSTEARAARGFLQDRPAIAELCDLMAHSKPSYSKRRDPRKPIGDPRKPIGKAASPLRTTPAGPPCFCSAGS